MEISGKRHKSDSLKHTRKGLRSEAGQSVILVAMLLISFMMFFTFTVNTGLLIAAKISVQTAADAAAYAGAATQARYLNSISYLNYDMRRQYKKYIFRSTFVGSIGSPKFPEPTKKGDLIYDFPKYDSTAGSNGLPTTKLTAINVPAICIPLTAGGKDDDNCIRINIPNSTYFVKQNTTAGAVDPMIKSMLAYQSELSLRQEGLCAGQGRMNFNILMAWLFRGDDSSNGLDLIFSAIGANPNADQTGLQEAKTTVKALVEGLGMYPRNIISYMRIQTLADLINSKGQSIGSELTKEKIDALENNVNTAEAAEKTIQAFKSALSNLNTSVFDHNLTSMTELEPQVQIRTHLETVDFNAYVQMMNKDGDTDGPTFCNSRLFAFPANSAPIGVTIDPSFKVNYAVKLKAFVKPRQLLFMPGNEALELDAVAGAEPFGSRIGPRVMPSLVNDIQPGRVNGDPACIQTTSNKCNVPVLAVGGKSNTFSVDYLRELVNRAKGGTATVNFAGLLNAEWHAMAPTPEEVGHYNILPPPPKDGYAFEFLDFNNGVDPKDASKRVHRFYAPIYPSGNGDPKQVVKNFMSQIFQKTQMGTNQFGISMKDVGQLAEETILNYLDKLSKGGELGETTTLAAIELPMSNLTPPSTNATTPFWLTNPDQVLSSWAPSYVRTNGAEGDAAFKFKPRYGYSVKFVSMSDLVSEWGAEPEGSEASKINH